MSLRGLINIPDPFIIQNNMSGIRERKPQKAEKNKNVAEAKKEDVNVRIVAARLTFQTASADNGVVEVLRTLALAVVLALLIYFGSRVSQYS